MSSGVPADDAGRKRASSPPAFLSRPVGSPAASFTMAPPAGLGESRVIPAARSAAVFSEKAYAESTTTG